MKTTIYTILIISQHLGKIQGVPGFKLSARRQQYVRMIFYSGGPSQGPSRGPPDPTLETAAGLTDQFV